MDKRTFPEEVMKFRLRALAAAGCRRLAIQQTIFCLHDTPTGTLVRMLDSEFFFVRKEGPNLYMVSDGLRHPFAFYNSSGNVVKVSRGNIGQRER